MARAFQKALANAKTVEIEAHNADGVARSQLTDLITKKLGKTIAPDGNSGGSGLSDDSHARQGRGHYEPRERTWARCASTRHVRMAARGICFGRRRTPATQDLPWPAVVHGLILQFQSRFHIK